MTNQPQYPQEPEYKAPEDPFTEPPTPPPYADESNDAAYFSQSQQNPVQSPYQAPQQYQPQQPQYQQQPPGQPYQQTPQPQAQPYQQQPQFQGPPQQYQPPRPMGPQFNPVMGPMTGQQRPRLVWPWVVGGIALVLVVGCVGGLFALGLGVDNAAKKLKAEASQSADAPSTAGTDTAGTTGATGVMGQPALDGDVEFTVRSMDCSKTTLGSDDPVTADGHFCVIKLHVVNTGSSQQFFTSAAEDVYGPDGDELTEDFTAETAYANGDFSASAAQLAKTLAPGDSFDATLIYDVPKSEQPSKIELHGSLLSDGVTVPLH